MLILIIAGGPDKGRIYELTDTGPIILGREGDQIKLNDHKVSREHARLWTEGGQWYLEDLGSRHGTYRNHTLLEAGQRAKVKDGDYLQIGSTVMVLGRMPAEHAERLSLLAEQTHENARARTWRKPVLIAGGASVAALLGLGVYIAIQLEGLSDKTISREEYAALQQQLAESQLDAASRIEGAIGAQTELDRQMLDQQQRLTASLDDTNDAISRHQGAIADAAQAFEGAADPIIARLDTVEEFSTRQQLAIERLGEMLAHQQSRDNSEQLMAMMAQVKQLVADQPSGDALIAKLREAIATNAEATGEAVRIALAQHAVSPGPAEGSDRTEVLLARVLEALEGVPTRDQIADQVRLAVAESRAQNEQFMRLVLAELRHTGDQISTEVAAAMDEDAGQAQSLMRQVVAELDKRPTGEQLASELRLTMNEVLVGQVDAAESEMPALMRRVLDELEQRPTSEQLAADLRRYIGEDAQKTEVLVARILSELEARPTAQQIASELRAVDNEAAARTAALLEDVLAKVNQQQQLATQIAQLRESIEAMPGRNEQAVREVLTRLDEQDRNNTEMLQAIAALRAAMPDDLPGRLDGVLAKLDEQVREEQITDAVEQAMQRLAAAQNQQTEQTVAAFSAKLAALPSAEQLAEVVQSQRALAELLDQTDAREAVGQLRASLDQLAAQMPDGPGEQLTQIIALLEKREQTELLLAELHDAMRGQSEQAESLRRELLAAIEAADDSDADRKLNELLAVVQSRLSTDASIRQAIRDELHGTILPNQMALEDARDVTTTATNPGEATTLAQGDTGGRLNQLERAYKESFETGRAVTVGAGVVNPSTGEVSDGRLLDPAVARALGFETWRDWYLTDRHAEQRRLQQQAVRQRNAIAAENPGLVELPDADAGTGVRGDRPEQD